MFRPIGPNMARIRVYVHRCDENLLKDLGYKAPGNPNREPFTIDCDVDLKLFERVARTKGALSEILAESFEGTDLTATIALAGVRAQDAAKAASVVATAAHAPIVAPVVSTRRSK